MLLTLAVRASLRGWTELSAFLLELDCRLSGLGMASRRIRKERARRAAQPKARFEIVGL